MWMDPVDTLPVVRYWSEVFCCTIPTHLCDLEVKVTDFEIYVFRWMDLVDTMLVARYMYIGL